MKRCATFILFFAFLFSACSIPNSSIFSKKSAHEKYADKVEDKYSKTPEGRQWLSASESSVQNPVQVKFPYRQHGVFLHDKQRAMGLLFQATAGEQLRFSLAKRSASPFSIFADIFQHDGTGTSLFFSADTSTGEFIVNIDRTGEYILRLQPALQQAGAYSLSVTVGPSLEFPVQGTRAKAGSFWGAPRDGGKRKHEGIDIFAPKTTPVIASADGMVSGIRNEGIGGKTIWLRSSDRQLSLYYAHLDSQMVSSGQHVKAGDIIGTVGNTGNAKTTSPHLHFGVYTYNGAIDPLPFVNQSIKQPAAVNKHDFEKNMKTKKAQNGANGLSIPANTVLIPLAVNAQGFLAELPDGQLLSFPSSAVKTIHANDVALGRR